MNKNSIILSIRKAIEKNCEHYNYRSANPPLNSAEAPSEHQRQPLYIDLSPTSDAVYALLHSKDEAIQSQIDLLFSWRIESISNTIDNTLRSALSELYKIENNKSCYDVRLVKEKHIGPFNLDILEALAETGLMRPLYALSYSAFYHDLNRLERLCRRYPRSAICLIGEPEFTVFHDTAHETIAEVIASDSDSDSDSDQYDDLFAWLVAPVSMTPRQYSFVVKSCLQIDEELTLLHLSEITTFSEEDMKKIANYVFGTASPMHLLNRLPAPLKPFVLTLFSKAI